MSRIRNIITPLVAVFAVAAFTPSAGAAEMAVEVMASNCFVCHGQQGASAGETPSISGLASDVIAKSLLDFKAGSKPSTIMGNIAKGYSDDQIKALADYFGKK
tara:strand:+ start:798 stop:1106 length:309 start_codon:yes stop_codon:yes gene_type:complete